MKDRDMYYGYGGFTPLQMPGMMQPQMSSMMQPQMSGMSSGTSYNSSYGSSQFNDINERLDRLERQVKRLDQILTRLETPYANSNSLYNNEPDNNMYMM